MSGESAPKHRLVLCPKCRQLLQEFPDYDVYKCGGCGAILQAKKRRSGAVNSKSATHDTDAASRNPLDHVSDDKQYSKGEHIVIPQENGLRVKPNGSSSGKCSSDGNNGTSQIENGEGSGEQVVLPQENGVREKASRSSSRECSLDGNDGRGQIENGECNGEQAFIPQNDLREKETNSSSGECSLDRNDGRCQTENSESNDEQRVLPQKNGLKEKAASSSSLGERSLDGSDRRGQTENCASNDERLVLHQENGLNEKEASSSSLGERSLNGDDGKDQLQNGERNGEQVVLPLENGVTEKATRSSSGECSLDGNDGRDQIENGECNGEQLGPFILSDEELEEEIDIYKLTDRKHRVSNKGSSNELSSREIKASSELIVENSVENANDTNFQLAMEELSNENMSLKGAGGELISALDEGDSNSDKLALVGAKPEVDITGSNKAEAERELNLGASDREDPKQDQSALVFAKSEVDTTGSASTFKRSSTENFLSEKGNIGHRKLEEGPSDNVSSPNKQWRQAQKSIHHSFDSVRHVDPFDATEVINPSSELSGTLGVLSKSPTTRSSHAYDGSVSSNDVVDERFLTQHLDSFENTYTESNGVSEGRSRNGKGLIDSMLYGNLEAQHQPYFPSAKGRRGNQNQVPEITRRGLPHWTRTKGDKFPSKMPFHRSGSQSGYESGSPSNQTQDELYGSSSFLSPDSQADPEEENLKLLRMFYKLQDQVNRTRYANEETNGRLSTDSYKGKHISAYHSHDFHDARFYHGLDYPRCDGRCGHGINWRQRHNFPCQYLAEATRSSNHVDCPCFHCCPQEWQCSAELPPHVLHQHAELSKYHLGRNRCSSHHSLPSSPQWLMSSELAAYGHETRSGNQRHMAPEMKNYLREKHNLNKRHYRPVAGGAPFVICHKCSKLLQLPADFLLFKRVYHWLKCGACSEVLKFSLQNRSHIVSYAPNALGPPSSDLDHQDEVITGGNLNSASHANYVHSSHAEPVSYSDDYGHSLSKSYSSEGDIVSLTPQHPLHGNEHDKLVVSRGTFEPITEEKISSRVPSMSETMGGTVDVASHSANVLGSEKSPSEIEAREPPKSSPLHQLMGYSSPSQVLRGVNSSVEGKETRFKVENDLSSPQN